MDDLKLLTVEDANVNFHNTIRRLGDYCVGWFRGYIEYTETFHKATKSNNWLKMHGYPMRRSKNQSYLEKKLKRLSPFATIILS